jgi:hypothetical protein
MALPRGEYGLRRPGIVFRHHGVRLSRKIVVRFGLNCGLRARRMGCIEFDLFGADPGRTDPDDRPVDIRRGRVFDRPRQVGIGRDHKRQETSADQHEILEYRHETPRHPLPIEAGITTGKNGKRSSTTRLLCCNIRLLNRGGRDKTAIITAWRFGMSIETAEAAASRAWETYRLINPSASEDLRSAMQRFVAALAQTNDLSAEALAVEGLKYLKGTENEGRPLTP